MSVGCTIMSVFRVVRIRQCSLANRCFDTSERQNDAWMSNSVSGNIVNMST